MPGRGAAPTVTPPLPAAGWGPGRLHTGSRYNAAFLDGSVRSMNPALEFAVFIAICGATDEVVINFDGPAAGRSFRSYNLRRETMTVRMTLSALLVTAAVCAGGCSNEAPTSEPRLPAGAKPDPRLVPEQAGGGAAPAQQSATKGD